MIEKIDSIEVVYLSFNPFGCRQKRRNGFDGGLLAVADKDFQIYYTAEPVIRIMINNLETAVAVYRCGDAEPRSELLEQKFIDRESSKKIADRLR